MVAVQEYILSVTGTAMLCAMIVALTGEKSRLHGAIRMVCGMIMVYSVVSPLSGLDVRALEEPFLQAREEGTLAARSGVDYSTAALERYIIDKVQSYIQDEAIRYDAKIRTEIILTDDIPPVPKGILITGSISPYGRLKLQTIIEEELGIPRENQIWKNS